MGRNIRIARELVRIARLLVASHENFGHYSIDFDKGNRTFTVYFILKEDAVESEALKNAKACRYEIKSVLERDKLIEVTNIEDNRRSFCFTIIVDKEDETGKKASFGWARVLVAEGEEDDDSGDGDSGGGDDGGFSLDDDEDSGGDDDSGDDKKEEEEQLSPEEQKRFKNVQDTVKRICRKYNWDTEK